MASTRNKNTRGDYTLERNLHTNHVHYMVTNHAYEITPMIPGNGLLGQVCPPNQLSKNDTDIESLLFGIHSTDLEGYSFQTEPEFKPLKSLNIQERTPLILPKQLHVQENQRPFPR
jgi:hypothetical protein